MLLPLALTLSAAAGDATPMQVEGVLCHPRNLIVQTTDPTSLRFIEAAGARVLTSYPELDVSIVEAPVGSLVATRNRIARAFGHQRVELDRAGRVAYTPNDPMYPDMWHPPAIKASTAWDLTLGSSSAIVAILDTGVQVNHPDLAANAWVNAGEIAGNGVDDDANGYVDDVNGYDFAYNDPNPDDVHGHGTACAGLAAAVGDNGVGVVGIAPKARIMALKVANNSGYFYASATIPAYLYGAKMGARVYSMSYYADGVTRSEGNALRQAFKAGVLPIAAAGNDRTVYPYYPGAYEFVLSVAALKTDLTKAWFSNWGSWVDVAAPGVSLVTTSTGSGYTSSFGGTSGACPIVAGVAGLLLGSNPSRTPTQLRTAITEAATLQSQLPYGEFSNYGLVDAEKALRIQNGGGYVRHAPKVSWISPIGSVDPATNPAAIGRVYGRNLNLATVEVNGSSATKTTSSKDWIDYKLPADTGFTSVKSGSNVLANVRPPLDAGYAYPLAEASSQAADVFGGFFETIRRDGKVMSVSRRSDGMVHLEGAFKNMPASSSYYLVIDRRYTNTTVGTERVQLYDWKTASYPYASFITLKESPVPTTNTRLVVYIPEITRYVDYEKNVYFRIQTSNDLPAGAQLKLDCAFIRPK